MTDSKKCPYCGKHLHNNAQFCMYCMHSFQPKKDVTPAGPSHTGRLAVITVCFVLAFLALVAAAIYIGFRMHSSDKALLIVMENGKSIAQMTVPGSTSAGDHPTSDGVPETGETLESDSDVIQPSEAVFSEPDVTAGAVATAPRPTAPQTTNPPQSASQTTNPVPLEPQPTEPVSTTPQVTVPQTTDPACSHYYSEATCVAPMACIYCGHTLGGVDSNGHNWTEETAIVHHEEVGHYEEQVDYVEKTEYLCFFCGYNQDGFDSMDELREHITVHSHEVYYSNVYNNLESFTDTREVWAPVTVTVWVVDQVAYDETIVTGYTCTLCGGKKDP